MARIARAVFPGLPHHITQRGNRRQATFLREEDYRVYLETSRYVELNITGNLTWI